MVRCQRLMHFSRVGWLAGAILAWALLGLGTALAQAACEGKLGPESKREALLAQPDEAYMYILRADAAGLKRARALHVKSKAWPRPVALAIIDGVAVNLKGADLPTLCAEPEITQLWYLHPRLADSYVRVMQGIEYTVRTLKPPALMNLSLGPPVDVMPLPTEPLEPMNEATRRAAERGIVPVMAIGNKAPGGTSPGPNPWCYPDWVICVGAATQNGDAVWNESVEGDPHDRGTWPDVVAAGVDIISTWPSHVPKPEARRRYDESHPEFLKTVPPDKRYRWTMMSGTSQAAPQVSRAAAQIMYFVHSMAQKTKAKEGQDLFSMEIPADRFAATSRLGPRLTGRVTRRDHDVIEVTYTLDQPWKLVKQLLIDSAVPMPRYPPYAAGAGFVDPAYIEKQFGQFGVVNKKVMPVKVR